MRWKLILVRRRSWNNKTSHNIFFPTHFHFFRCLSLTPLFVCSSLFTHSCRFYIPHTLNSAPSNDWHYLYAGIKSRNSTLSKSTAALEDWTDNRQYLRLWCTTRARKNSSSIDKGHFYTVYNAFKTKDTRIPAEFQFQITGIQVLFFFLLNLHVIK